jgi:carboxyl-terminal processing protease
MSRLISQVARLRCSRWMLVASLVLSLSPAVWADPTLPGPKDRHITLTVTSLLTGQHLLRHPLDKEISERGLKMFLKSLDPMKVYFYQSDVDVFMAHQDELADALRRGDTSFSLVVFQKFLERVDERVKTVDELLAAPVDFTADEEMVKDRESAKYPRDSAEARDLWRKRIKYDLLVLKTNKKEGDASPAFKIPRGAIKRPVEMGEGQEAIDRLTRRYHSFAKRMHQVDNNELLEMYLNAFTTSLDPHTDYMSPKMYKNFIIAMSLELEGIGASLMSEDGYTVVKQIISRGAADKDGRLKIDDRIVGVGQGDEGEITDIVDMKLQDVVDLIRGPRGTAVRLEVVPADGGERKVYRILREKIELRDSEAKGKVFEAGKKADGTPYRIGVIDLPSFYRDMDAERSGDPDFKSATRDVLAILDDFNRQQVDAVVLDLRANGGGSLTEAVSLTGLFIDRGPVVQVKTPGGRVQEMDDTVSGMAWSGPLVVLASKFSASASEILVGAIQDYGRGVIVGDHSTHGKGTVQSLMDLGQKLFPGLPNTSSYGALKITVSQFYRPCGDSTQKRGVVSDIELPSFTNWLEGVSESDLDYPVAFDQVEPLSYQHSGNVNAAVCAQLRQLSEQRRSHDEKFQKLARKVERYKEQKAKKYVPLNEEKFIKERTELNADREEEKLLDKRIDPNNADIERDEYLDEAMAIAIDLMNLEQVAKAPQASLGAQN